MSARRIASSKICLNYLGNQIMTKQPSKHYNLREVANVKYMRPELIKSGRVGKLSYHFHQRGNSNTTYKHTHIHTKWIK